MSTRGSGTISVMHYEQIIRQGTVAFTPAGIIKVPFLNSLEPFALIIARLRGKLGHKKILKIEYLGQEINIQKPINIGSLLLDTSNTNILLSVRTRTPQPQATAEVRVILWDSDDQRPLTISIDGIKTIKDLKLRLQTETNVHYSKQIMMLSGGTMLQDRYPLSYYNIEHQSTLLMQKEALGGGGAIPFVDFEYNQVENVQFSEKAPAWRIVSEGTNIEGICMNPNCVAYENWVIAREGFGQVDLVCENFKCPMCHNNFAPKTCGFYMCEWNFVGKKAGENKNILGQYTKVGGSHYERFNEQDKQADWVSLQIVSREDKVDGECTICLQDFSIRSDKWVSNCNHTFHSDCIQDYIASMRFAGQQAFCLACYNTDFIN
eukprot:TRINITY_DN339_c3_g1_i1.p1 TRINITY_DN339_c3_g1~~TRINITY_DN339_c3_g1_i1.p1  ORF type:complete len:377 (+),score=7.45 TRINITY_DN339_c3_g1_i1:187-1317(+)